MFRLLFGGVLIFFSLFTSHSLKDLKFLARGEREDIIMKNAREAIGVENYKIKSFHVKSKRLYSTKNETVSNQLSSVMGYEITALIPDKFQLISTAEEPSQFTFTSIWNGSKFKKLSETDIFGERVVRDVTQSSLNRNEIRKLEGKLDKEKLEKLKQAGNKDPKENLNNQIWLEIFPLILNNPIEENLEYKFVGKAQLSDRIANIIDVKSKYERNYRLLFDSETSILLMMIETFKGIDGEYEIKYYYSNREKVDGLLIPKKIKAEQKITTAEKEPRISYLNIDILEFKINPELKERIFEIK